MKHDIITYGKIGEVTAGGALSQEQFLNDLLKNIDDDINNDEGKSNRKLTRSYLIQFIHDSIGYKAFKKYMSRNHLFKQTEFNFIICLLLLLSQKTIQQSEPGQISDGYPISLKSIIYDHLESVIQQNGKYNENQKINLLDINQSEIIKVYDDEIIKQNVLQDDEIEKKKKNEPDLSSINSNDNASDVIDDKEMLNVWDKQPSGTVTGFFHCSQSLASQDESKKGRNDGGDLIVKLSEEKSKSDPQQKDYFNFDNDLNKINEFKQETAGQKENENKWNNLSKAKLMKKNRSKSKVIEDKQENTKSNDLVEIFFPNEIVNTEPNIENNNIINDQNNPYFINQSKLQAQKLTLNLNLNSIQNSALNQSIEKNSFEKEVLQSQEYNSYQQSIYQKFSSNTFDKREEYTAGDLSSKQRKDSKQQNSQTESKNKRNKLQNKQSSRSRSKKIKSTSEYAFKKLEKELDNRNLQQVLTTDDLDGFLKEIDQGEHQLHLFLKQEEEDLNKRLKEAEKKLNEEDQLDGPIDYHKLALAESLLQYQNHTTVPSSIPHTTQVTNNILDQLSPNNLQNQKQNGYQDSSSSSSKQSSQQNDDNNYGRRFYQQQKKFNGERATSLETYVSADRNMSHILGSFSANKALSNAHSFMMAHNATMRGNQFSPNNYTAEKVKFNESDNKFVNIKTQYIKLKNENNQIKKVGNLKNLSSLKEQNQEIKNVQVDFHKSVFQINKSGKVSDSSIGRDIGNIQSQQVLHTDRPAFGEQRYDLLTIQSIEPPAQSAQKQKSNIFNQDQSNKQAELNYQINFQNQMSQRQFQPNSRSMIGPSTRSNEQQLSVISGISSHSKYSANNPQSLINHSQTTLRSRFPFCSSSKQTKNQFDQHFMNQKYMKKDQMQIQKQTSSSTINGDIYKSQKIDKNFSSYSIIKSPKDQTKLTSSVFINISDASAGLIKINNTRHYEGNEMSLGNESIVNGLSVSAIKQTYLEDKSIKSPNNSTIPQKDFFANKNFRFDQKVIKEYNQSDEEESEQNLKRDLSHLVSCDPVQIYSPTSQNSYQLTNEKQKNKKNLTSNQYIQKQNFISDNEQKLNFIDKNENQDPFIKPFTAISQSQTKEKNITNIYQVISSIKAQVNDPKKSDKKQVQTVSFKLDLNRPSMLQTFAADQQIINSKTIAKQPRLSESGDQFIINSQRDKISVLSVRKLKTNIEIQKETVKKLTESQSQQILRPVQQYQTYQQEGMIVQQNLIQQSEDKLQQQQISYTQLFKNKQQLSQRKQKSSTVSQAESPQRQDNVNSIKLKRRDRGARGQTGNQASLNIIKDFIVEKAQINHSDVQDKNFYQKQHQKSINSKLSQTYQQIQSNNQSEDHQQNNRLNNYKSNLAMYIQTVSGSKKQSAQFTDFKQKQRQSFQKTRNEKDSVSYKIQNKTLEFGSMDSQANQLGAQESESNNKSMVHAQYYAATSTIDDIQSSPTNIQQNNHQIETSFAKDSSIVEVNKVQVNTSNDLKKYDRMVELLLGQLKRRRNKNVKIDVQQEDKLNLVLQYWKESLCKEKLIQKLQQKATKMNETSTGQSQSHYDINSKFSYKEKWLLQYLEGTDLTSLMTLAEDSSTRTYGELATVDVHVLVGHVCRYLRLDLVQQNYQL